MGLALRGPGLKVDLAWQQHGHTGAPHPLCIAREL